MKIAFIGVFGARQDEGMRKLCEQIARAVPEGHEFRLVSTQDFGRGRSLGELRRFRPDVLHYLTGPTVRSLTALRAHRALLPGRPVTIATGVRPYFGAAGRAGVRWLAPDIYLAQARRWQRLFAAGGSRCIDFPNLTDFQRFEPVSISVAARLREQWHVPADRKLVLHVGHVKANRNLAALIEAQLSARYQVLIVGSESESRPGPWRQELEAAGCRVHTAFIPNIQEVYQAADAYVFTVRATPADDYPRHYDEIGVIDMPLSVLEARACGLPVVATRHDALQHFLGGDEGMHWFDGSGEDAIRQLDQLTGGPVRLDVRFDGRQLGQKLADVYTVAASLHA